MRTLVLVLLGVSTLLACSDDSETPTPDLGPPDTGVTAQTGRALYDQPHVDGNTFACASCHALSEPAADGIRRPGHQIGDAAQRPNYKNGAVASLREAVNSCRVEWMGATAFEAEDDRWVALRSFLEEQAGASPAAALSYDIVAPPADLSGGAAMPGQELFNSSCAGCHGNDAVGTERAPILVGEFLEAGYIAERVRRSGRTDSSVYPGLSGGRMPFWAADRLSDDELRDLVAFVQLNDPRTISTPDAGTADAGGSADAGVEDSGAAADGGGSGCGSTHPKIGQTANLIRRSHQVGGTATILDDCTIEITDFDFDGLGIDVQLYSGLGGDYDNGFSMSGDIRRSRPYVGETIRATLPPGRTLDELDGISVWCVPVGVSFGDGRFQ